MDTFTHHFCANGHGGTIGTGFPYIRRVDRRTLTPVQYIVLSSLLCWQSLLYSLQPSSQPFYKVSIRPSLLCNTLRNRLWALHRDPCHCSSRRAKSSGQCQMVTRTFPGMLAMGLTLAHKSSITLSSLCEGYRVLWLVGLLPKGSLLLASSS